MHGMLQRAAKLRYLDGTYEVIEPGQHVICAVTGRIIPLEQLCYWSVPRQEPYADARAALTALRRDPPR